VLGSLLLVERVLVGFDVEHADSVVNYQTRGSSFVFQI